MTYREKLARDCPETDYLPYSELGCPYKYGYENVLDRPCYGNDMRDCRACWYREIPETKDADEGANAIGALSRSSSIKDSGNRRQFESGAVRDMQEGKGRCDLMPLEVVARMFSENSMFEDPIIRGIRLFLNNDYDTEYLYHTLVVFCGKRYDGFAPTMLLEVAKHFEEGAKKYGENNWQKGIPVNCYIDSAVRHYLKWLRGDKDEPHDRAFVWNIMCCIWEVDYREDKENG